MRTWRSENFFSSSRVRLWGMLADSVVALEERRRTVAGPCGSQGGEERERR